MEDWKQFIMDDNGWNHVKTIKMCSNAYCDPEGLSKDGLFEDFDEGDFMDELAHFHKTGRRR